MTTKPQAARWAGVAAASACWVVGGVSLALFAFAQPLADDFCTASSSQGLSDYLRHMYSHWSGRWLSLAVEKLVLSNLDPTRVYPGLLAALALSLLGSLCLFVRGFFQNGLSRRMVFVLAGCFFVVYWSLHPALGQTYYWFTGGVEYQLSLALALTVLALVMNGPGAGRLSRYLTTVAVGTLAFLAPGTHELFGLMLCVLLVGGAMLAGRLGSSARNLWIIAAVCAVAGFLIVVAAPGYSVRRAEYFPDGYNVLLTLWLTPWQAVKAGTEWIGDAKLLAATALFVVHPSVRAMQPEWIARAPQLWRRVALGGWTVLLAIGFGVPSFAMGQEMPGRVLGGVYFVFLLGWFIVVFILTRQAAGLSVPADPSGRVLSWAMVVFALCIAATGNTRIAIYDLVHRAEPWSRALEQRYESIRVAAGQAPPEVVVPAPPIRPRTFFQGPADITSQTSDWKNRCQAEYFGVSSLRHENANE